MTFQSPLSRFAVVITLILTPVPRALGQTLSDQQVNQMALQDLNSFLNSPAARQEFAKGRPDAMQANTFFEKFPAYAQTEIMEIVMLVMTETNGKPTQAKGNIQATYDHFSPGVKARISQLQQRLQKDPAFNTPTNLQMMRSFFPAFLGAPAT